MKRNFFPRILFLLFLYGCSGIDGPQLVTEETFEDRKSSAIRWKLLLCFPVDPSQIPSTKTDLLGSILTGVVAGFSSVIPDKGALYLEKDVDFCEQSLFVTPCGNTLEEFALNHMSTLIQSCEPKIACMGGKDHPGTGTFCIDWDR